MSKDMTELDRIILEFYLDLQPDNYDEATKRFKGKMKVLMKELTLDLVKDEQKNWDSKDDQEMWGYQALDKLSETVEEL